MTFRSKVGKDELNMPRAPKRGREVVPGGASSLDILRCLSSQPRPKTEDRPIRRVVRNPGVDEREARDNARTSVPVLGGLSEDERIRVSLVAKAELYDQLLSQQPLEGLPQPTKSLLIDLEQRRKMSAIVSSIARSEGPTSEPNRPGGVRRHSDEEEDAEVEIEDSFGRTRLVPVGGQAHKQFLLAQDVKRLGEGTRRVPDPEPNHNHNPPPGMWAWSRGSNQDESIIHGEAVVSYERLMKDRVESALSNALDRGRKDRSELAPWDRVLGASAREYIDQVNQETQSARLAAGKGEASSDTIVHGDCPVFR